jgi:hypothetical protein
LGTNLTSHECVRPLHISIGRIPLSLFIPGETLHERALTRYRGFEETRAEGLPIFFGEGSQNDLSSNPGRDPSIGRSLELSSTSFSYALDDALVLLDSSRAEFHGVRHEYALDSLLRILLTMILLPRRGFLLHAATVVRDGHAYVFAGRSGAGKSTVASLSPAGTVLTDEISLLRFTDGRWHAYGTPFWGEFRAAGLNEHYPIAGIYALEQAPEDRVEPLAAKEILRALLPCVLFFTSNPEANRALLHMLLGMAQQIPCHRLHFRRNNEFWKVVAP